LEFSFPDLPYKLNALEPYLTENQVRLHFEGHLKGYVDKLNKIPEVVDRDWLYLEDLVVSSNRERASDPLADLPPVEKKSYLFNQSSQVYNHVFYFKNLCPGGGGPPGGDMGEIIRSQYGSWEQFRKKVVARGTSLFGSGYVWVCLDDEARLVILRGYDSATPIAYKGLSPLMCIDVWEHAYYVDYNLHRAQYIEAVLDHLINWNFVHEHLRRA